LFCSSRVVTTEYGRAVARAVSRPFPSRPPCLSLDQVIWNLWWIERHWGRFILCHPFYPLIYPQSSPSFILGWYSWSTNGRSNRGLGSTPGTWKLREKRRGVQGADTDSRKPRVSLPWNGRIESRRGSRGRRVINDVIRDGNRLCGVSRLEADVLANPVKANYQR
jgi:hypothetical protein